jgi:hypothetical protein
VSNPETGNCQLIGIQDRQVGTRCVSALLQVAVFGLLLERVDRRTLAFFEGSTMTAEAIGAGYASDRSVRACIDALVEGGQIEATLTRGRGYMIRITATIDASASGRGVRSERTHGPVKSSEVGHPVQESWTHGPDELDTRSGTLLMRSPQEDPHKKIPTEDASHPLASSRPAPPSPAAPAPITARSPATMPTPSQPSPTETTTAALQGDGKPISPKTRKPRGKKPTLTPLTVDALTAYERAVHDAIVADPTLSQICHDVPQLARDLVALADGKLDVVAKVKALAVWNRNNPAKAWKTTGGNRGLTTCITRDAQGSHHPSSTRPTHQPAPANHDPATSPPRQKVYAPPPPPRPVLVSGEGETFLERMARMDPQAKAIIEKHKVAVR